MSSETLLSKYGMEVMIVVDNKNDPTKTGCVTCYNPMKHGPNYTKDDLAFSNWVTPTQYMNNRPPDPGSALLVMRPEGAPNGIILGKINERVMPGFSGKDGQTGGRDMLSSSELFMNAFKESRMNLPPNIQRTVENGVEVNKVVEKGDGYSHSSREGLPSTGPPSVRMAGSILPQVKNVETALKGFADLIPAGIFSQFPVLPMSIGTLLRKLVENNLLKGIADKLPEEVRVALASATSLISEVEVTGAIYPTNMLVEPTTFLGNAVTLLGQVTNTSDMFDAFHRLQTDSSLFGLDKIASIPLDLSTPFGILTRSINIDGSSSSKIPEVVQLLLSGFGDLITGGSFGVLPGQVMFGESAALMNDFMNRASGITLSQIKERIEANNLGTGRIVSEAMGFAHTGNLSGLIGKVKSMAGG